MTTLAWRAWEVGRYDDEDARLGYVVRNYRTSAPHTEIWFESADGRVRYMVGAAVGARVSARDAVATALSMRRVLRDRIRLDMMSSTASVS